MTYDLDLQTSNNQGEATREILACLVVGDLVKLYCPLTRNRPIIDCSTSITEVVGKDRSLKNIIVTSGQSNLTNGRFSTAHGR